MSTIISNIISNLLNKGQKKFDLYSAKKARSIEHALIAYFYNLAHLKIDLIPLLDDYPLNIVHILDQYLFLLHSNRQQNGLFLFPLQLQFGNTIF